MYETKPYFYGTGRRKHSVARVRVYNGTGKVTINGRDINDYFGLETLKLLVNSPLVLTENEGKFDVVVNVVGGGCAGQAGAIRHGLSLIHISCAWACRGGKGPRPRPASWPWRGRQSVRGSWRPAR